MDAHCVRTGEDALLLYLNPKGELQEKQKWEDGGERHFVPHECKCGTYLRKKHINAFSGGRDHIHLVEQNVFHNQLPEFVMLSTSSSPYTRDDKRSSTPIVIVGGMPLSSMLVWSRQCSQRD